jgi:signal transduction histidine kinase
MTWLRAHCWTIVDTVGAAARAAAAVLGIQNTGRHPTVLMALLLVAQVVPLPWRRRFPAAVLALTSVAGLGLALLGWPMLPAALTPLLALYTLAVSVPRASSVTALAGTAALTGSTVLTEVRPSGMYLLVTVLALLSAWAMGVNTRTRRAYLARLAADRAEGERRAAAAERVRIARELHDLVTHNVTVMVITAGAGRVAADADPHRLRSELATVEQVGRQTLVELRRLLGVLRTGEQPTQPRTPAPGLAQLTGLVEDTRRAGLAVELVVDGQPRPLPPGVDASAYRIVQEALANTLRHASPCTARVDVCYTDRELHLAVVNDGAPVPVPSGGHGLVGMRERVAMIGGRIEAGPRPTGGFAVRVSLPLEDR